MKERQETAKRVLWWFRGWDRRDPVERPNTIADYRTRIRYIEASLRVHAEFGSLRAAEQAAKAEQVTPS